MVVLFVLALIVALATVPIMIGARVVEAEHDLFGRALFAALLIGIVPMFVKSVTAHPLLGFVIGAAVGGFFLSFIMGTTFLRGLGIGAIAAVVVHLVAALFAGVLMGASALSA